LTVLIRGFTFFGWMVAFLCSMAVIGLIPSVPIFVIAYMRLEGAAPENAGKTLADIANLYLGGFLSMSPNMLGFESGPENVNAHLVGVAIIALAMAAIYARLDLEEWLNLGLGLWLVVSPWVLHFDSGAAKDAHVIVGALVSALAAVELWLSHRKPRPRVQHTPEKWRHAIAMAIVMTALIYGVFDQLLTIPWPPTVLGTYFPWFKFIPSV
jgi:hypothetical protein